MRAPALAFAVLVGFGVSAQMPPPLTEKIEVNIVNVDVTVTDHGALVQGLGRDDFELFEDDKAQPITNFYAVEDAAPHAESSSESAPDPQRFRRKVLVLIDNLNASVHGRNQALQRLETFINERFHGDYEWSISTVDRRQHVLLPLTQDKAAIHSVLVNVRRDPTWLGMSPAAPKGEAGERARGGTLTAQESAPGPNPRVGVLAGLQHDEAAMQSFLDLTDLKQRKMLAAASLAAISDAAQAFAAVEGKKIILLVSGGLPLDQAFEIESGQTTQSYAADPTEINNANRLMGSLRDTLIHQANASNTSVYIIGTEGQVPAPGFDVSSLGRERPISRLGSALPDTSAMNWIAHETGGKYLPGNSMDESLRDFDKLSTNFYSLGYRPGHVEDGLYHHIDVRVKGHPSYALQFRTGYSSVAGEAQLERSLRSFAGVGMQPVAFPIAMEVGAPSYEKDRAIVPLHISVPMDRVQFLTDANGSRGRMNVYVSVFDADGRNLGLKRIAQDISLQPGEQTSGKRIVMNIPGVTIPKGGSYQIVVAVRDEITDTIGLTMNKVSL